MLKAFYLRQVSSLTLIGILVVVAGSRWNIDGAGASSSSSVSTICGRWANRFHGATRPTRLDASGFSITSNSRQRLPSSSSMLHTHSEHECTSSSSASSSLSSSAGSTGNTMIHRGGAASERVKTMTAGQMELFK
jgi:hypothetical protein